MSLAHLEEKSPFGEYIQSRVGFVDNGQTLVAIPSENGDHYLPSTLNTISLNPQNSSISSALLGSSSIDYLISSSFSDIDVIKSIYIDFNLTNTHTGTSMYVAPSPFIYRSQQFLAKLPTATYEENEHSHLSLLYCCDRDKCHYIIERENFIDLQSQDMTDFLVTGSGTGNNGDVLVYPSLSINDPILPGESRVIRLYMLGGPLLQKGFATGLLRNQQDLTLRYFFKPTSQWCSLPNNITVSTPRLQITGLKISPFFRQAFVEAVMASNAVVIPYTSYIIDARPSQSFSANQQNTFVLTNTKCLASYLFSYVRKATPGGESLTALRRYVQDSLPRAFNVDFTDQAVTETAGNWGESYRLENWALKPQGGLSAIISDATRSSEISEMFQVANGYRSYLAAEYKSLYFIPLGSKINPDISQITYSAGVTNVDNTFTVTFETLENLTESQYITVIGAASALIVTPDNVFNKIL